MRQLSKTSKQNCLELLILRCLHICEWYKSSTFSACMTDALHELILHSSNVYMKSHQQKLIGSRETIRAGTTIREREMTNSSNSSGMPLKECKLFCIDLFAFYLCLHYFLPWMGKVTSRIISLRLCLWYSSFWHWRRECPPSVSSVSVVQL